MALRVLIVLLILAIPLELPGCGPFFPEAVFFRPVQPESPDFATGKLGILQPTYERLYQVIAYRYLAGIGLNDAERAAIFAEPGDAGYVEQDIAAWIAARNAVPGVKPLTERGVDAFREVKKEGYFDTYLNCNGDAFRTAVATLARIKQTAGVADWVAAQDQVFSNCSKGSEIPAPAASAALPQERAYQIASAKFYSEQYDAARADFQAIGMDAASPWHEMGPYLGARCLIRAKKWAEAEAALKQVAADRSSGRWREQARRLLGYVQVRARPEARMHELALALVEPNSQATIGQDLIDYRYQFDLDVKPQGSDDLTDWILSFQANGAAALDKWRARKSLPWLVAALQGATPKDAATAELLAAASEVKADSPAYLTVNYHRVRLMAAEDARSLADGMLTGVRDLPVGARNQFRAERLALARDFGEFLKFASRREIPEGTDQAGELLDNDAASVLNRAVPLALLKQASQSLELPAETRNQLRSVVATRTLLFSASPKFNDVLELLRTPGGSPFVRAGYGRNTKQAKERDIFRDNWWCGVGKDSADSPAAAFLPKREQDQAAAEWARLAALPPGPNWLSAETVKYATAHTDDARVPEALAMVVTATRYGCTDEKTGAASKAAFDLLHRKYPNSQWAKKTPYWYK